MTHVCCVMNEVFRACCWRWDEAVWSMNLGKTRISGRWLWLILAGLSEPSLWPPPLGKEGQGKDWKEKGSSRKQAGQRQRQL